MRAFDLHICPVGECSPSRIRSGCIHDFRPVPFGGPAPDTTVQEKPANSGRFRDVHPCAPGPTLGASPGLEASNTRR